MKFILWNKEAGYVGNSIMFWAKNGNGYTCNIDNAELFDEDYARKYAESSYGKFVALPFSDIESLSRREVDIQLLRPYLDSKRLHQLKSDPDTGKIYDGHICKHGVRYPHECKQCGDDAWERYQLEQKQKNI